MVQGAHLFVNGSMRGAWLENGSWFAIGWPMEAQLIAGSYSEGAGAAKEVVEPDYLHYYVTAPIGVPDEPEPEPEPEPDPKPEPEPDPKPEPGPDDPVIPEDPDTPDAPDQPEDDQPAAPSVDDTASEPDAAPALPSTGDAAALVAAALATCGVTALVFGSAIQPGGCDGGPSAHCAWGLAACKRATMVRDGSASQKECPCPIPCWPDIPSGELKERLARVRYVFTDLDGTMLAPGSCALTDAAGNPSLDLVTTLVDLKRAGIEVIPCSGRNRSMLHEDSRVFGLNSYIGEMGGLLMLDRNDSRWEYFTADMPFNPIWGFSPHEWHRGHGHPGGVLQPLAGAARVPQRHVDGLQASRGHGGPARRDSR